jgi:hypothetical protein
MRATFRDSQVLCRILACQINLDTGLSIDGLAGDGPRQETTEMALGGASASSIR